MFLSQYNQLKIKIDTIIDLDIERKKTAKKSGLTSSTIDDINSVNSLDASY